MVRIISQSQVWIGKGKNQQTRASRRSLKLNIQLQSWFHNLVISVFAWFSGNDLARVIWLGRSLWLQAGSWIWLQSWKKSGPWDLVLKCSRSKIDANLESSLVFSRNFQKKNYFIFLDGQCNGHCRAAGDGFGIDIGPPDPSRVFLQSKSKMSSLCKSWFAILNILVLLLACTMKSCIGIFLFTGVFFGFL